MFLNEKNSYFLESRMINPEDISYISEIVLDFIKKLPDQIIITDINVKNIFHKTVSHDPSKKVKDIQASKTD